MKTKLILRNIGSLFFIISIFLFSSCSKTTNKDITNENIKTQETQENQETIIIDENDFTESDDDLASVDYKEFYDQLSPHGEWLQVSSEEIGMNLKTSLSDSPENNFSFTGVMQVKEVNAASAVNEKMIYVWKPSTELGISLKTGDTPEFIPYSNGQWVDTDAGWYFKAPTPAEEIVSHYGRWVNSATAGWMWVPGRVWAPAWVDWKENNEYVSWAPLPPSVYLVNNVMSVPVINDKNYMIVDKKHFLEPSVYKYNTLSIKSGAEILAENLKATDGITIINNTIINQGPQLEAIQKVYGKEIKKIKIKHAGSFKDVSYTGDEYNVFFPGFKRFKVKDNSGFIVKEPKTYKRYKDWIVKKSEGTGNKGNDIKKENDDYDDNGNDKIKKSDDDGNKNNGNNNKGNDDKVKKNNKDDGGNNNNNDDGNKKKNSGTDNKKNDDNGKNKNDDGNNGKGKK